MDECKPLADGRAAAGVRRVVEPVQGRRVHHLRRQAHQVVGPVPTCECSSHLILHLLYPRFFATYGVKHLRRWDPVQTATASAPHVLRHVLYILSFLVLVSYTTSYVDMASIMYPALSRGGGPTRRRGRGWASTAASGPRYGGAGFIYETPVETAWNSALETKL